VPKLAKAAALRRALLEAFNSAWEKRPDGFFPIQQVWNGVYRRFSGRVDGPLVEGSFNGLLHEGHLEAIQASNGLRGARITDRGRRYLYDLRSSARTRWIALIGAITGSVSLLVSILKLLTDLMGKRS
jgi:hypothetical protein